MRGKCMRIVQCGSSQAVAGSAEAASPRSPGGRCRLSSRVHLLRPGRAGACETFHTRRRVSSGKDAVCLSRRRPRGRPMSGPCLTPAVGSVQTSTSPRAPKGLLGCGVRRPVM